MQGVLRTENQAQVSFVREIIQQPYAIGVVQAAQSTDLCVGLLLCIVGQVAVPPHALDGYRHAVQCARGVEDVSKRPTPYALPKRVAIHIISDEPTGPMGQRVALVA